MRLFGRFFNLDRKRLGADPGMFGDIEEDALGTVKLDLEAANPVAVQIARTTFNLPYFNADMNLHDDGQWITYHSRRIHHNAALAQFEGRYRPDAAARLLLGIIDRDPALVDSVLAQRADTDA